MKRKIIFITAAVALMLCGCGKSDFSTETATHEELTTTTEKVPEIATDEATTALVTEAPTTEEQTTERITTEKSTEEVEDTTGEVDVNGYGWVQLQYSATYHITENHLTRSNGVVYYAGHKETWYSTKEASGQATAVSIPGKHVADDGTIRDAEGYVCVASSDLAFYTIVMTTVGPGKVYDCGCSSGTIDVYTTW